MTEHISVRRGVYRDSVTLLRISQAAASVPGVTAAQVAMATPLNTELAADLGFSTPDGAGPNDLMITIRGADDAAVAAALAAVDTAMNTRAGAGSTATGPAPRTVRAAAAAHPEAPITLLSVPGPAVLGEAMDAIDAGRHVMIFSDNVPIEDELALKDRGCRGRRAGDGAGLWDGHHRRHRTGLRQRAADTGRRPSGRRRRRLRNRCAATDVPAGRCRELPCRRFSGSAAVTCPNASPAGVRSPPSACSTQTRVPTTSC